MSLAYGDTVEVQTAADGPITDAGVRNIHPHNDALAGCVLVEFSNGTRQWMPGKYMTVKR